MRLIDADKYLKETCTYKDTGCGSCIFQCKCIADEPAVFELPDNPTNGDMIMAIFPTLSFNAILSKMYASCGQGLLDWWNAPYERR